MSSKKDLVLALFIIGFIIGFILFLDEIHMIFPFLIDYDIKGGFLGDLSQYHIEGFHHWQFGVILMIVMAVCIVGVMLNSQKGR